MSHELWQKWRAGPAPDPRETGRAQPRQLDGYSYVRGRQESASEVSFTVLQVRGERVVLRALLSADPRRLSSFTRRAGQIPAMASQWVERGAAIGTHAGAAPAKTIDELYAQCSQLIAESGASPPRLYFHPNGILMQCGHSLDDCADCPSASISSVSKFLVDEELPRDDAAAWLCETETGPVPPAGSLPFLPPDFACFAAELPPARRSVAEGTGAAEADRRCSAEPDGCAPQSLTRDICAIDPAACPPPEAGFGKAHLVLVRPQICATGAEHVPGALEVGKSDPLSVWTFPFQTAPSIECSGGRFLRRIAPQP